MASDMLLGGAHLRDVQAALDHAHLETTRKYIPLVVDGLEAPMNGRSYHQAGCPSPGTRPRTSSRR
jgi:site-specific recombinase XerD